MTQTKICPVCQMAVVDDTYKSILRGMTFWLCSKQCQDRFSQKPSLYVGDPKHGKSAKQHGIKVQKTRVINLQLPDNAESVSLLIQSLMSLMGVQQAKVNQGQLEIEYDLLQVSLEDIENQIKSIGVELSQSWLDKIHEAFIHFHEEGQLDNLSHPYKDS